MRIQLFRKEGFGILGLFTLILFFRYDNGYIVGYIDRNNAYGKTHAIMAQMQYLPCLFHPVWTTDANLWNTHMCISSEIVGHREWRFPVQQSYTGPATKMICICKHIHYLLVIAMLWHKQAIFKSKRDKLSSSTECMIRTQGLRHLFASRLNACWQTDWAIEDQALKNLNSTACPYDQQAFSPLDLTASLLSHLALMIYIFVVVNFDTLAQAGDIRIERRQVVFLCWMQDSNPRSQTPIRQQTECLLTNRLSYLGSSQLPFAPGSGDMYI